MFLVIAVQAESVRGGIIKTVAVFDPIDAVTDDMHGPVDENFAQAAEVLYNKRQGSPLEQDMLVDWITNL